MVSNGRREMQLRVHSFIRKENTPFWREKHLRIPDHLCGWLKLEEEPEVSRNNQEFNHRRAMHVKKRSSGVKTRCKFEQVLNINLNVWSAKGSTAHLQQVCAVLVLCALVQWICAGDIKMKSVQMLNGWSRNFLAWALKASLKASVLAASIIVSGSSFHSLTDLGKSYIYIYISPATSTYKFKWVVISCLAFLLTEVP